MELKSHTPTQAEVIRRHFSEWVAESMLDGDRYSSDPDNAHVFTTVDQLIRTVQASGSHFFDRDTLRFFKARTGSTLVDGRFFIVSDQYEDDPRRYQVAYVIGEDGEMLSIERTERVDSLHAARTLANLLADAFPRA